MLKQGLVACAIAAVLAATATVGGDKTVTYPDGYRSWTHLKSMVIQPGHSLADPFEGMHHVYANRKAMEGMQSGRYAKGAVFVFDLLEYKEDSHALVEGTRKFIGVMEQNQGYFSATGGWGFEVFKGSSRTERAVNDDGKSCFACHANVKDSAFVFSKYRQ